MFQSRSDELLEQVKTGIECPPATQDISLNLTNRKTCVDKANYGPANPQLENNDFWQKKADLFKTSIAQAQTMKCKNCAAFVQKEKMMKCIEKGIASTSIEEEDISKEIVGEANLGYCELFDFKCAGERTCDAWITGGPLKDNMSEASKNLTTNPSQGKIGETGDELLMSVSEGDDISLDASKTGLWDNIRKKKERMGKNYRPAKPGDKDRPDGDQWKKLTKKIEHKKN